MKTKNILLGLIFTFIIGIVSAYPTYPSLTADDGFNVSEGLQVLPQYVNSVTNGIFMPLFFLVLWLSLSITSWAYQQRIQGDANLFASFSVIGLGVFLFMVMLSLISSLVSFSILATAFFIEAICLVLFFVFERNQ